MPAPFKLLATVSTLILTTISLRAADDAALIARGNYLVNDAIGCADCHSPRNERGEFIKSQWLMGAPLPFKPLVEMPWSPAAPPIAGLPSMTTEQGIKFLQTGVRPDGTSPRPPMPAFRLNESDASAVVAYLKSLAK